ncbi:16S rRNA (guanine966-N2)-methyltransferase [Palleronia aestuarii]|uniref:16S rRNA (Guanine966-N2)-methyltransferase n=1 Tax=Palleronia aestuarii TaxID=568105 RepID=A0A2W7P072_9RHOB|nr:16S rRNA (guanine(966)-N(2))-methyltransferase RsmD [Palleronia aestuarii]PZX18866.1 16S rRNA (guanine966-N2)-methyltransferase [Palleronia aestuarii]
MRIVAGSLGGRSLAALGKGDAAAHLRPTTDRVRESLFNVLAGGAFGDPLDGAAVLDLFAGTGALGIEALSRGAASARFVENGRKGQALVAKNLAALGLGDRATLLRADATRLGRSEIASDLVFLDPPYGAGLGERAMSAAIAGGWIAPGALIVWEEATAPILPQELVLLDRRRYGDTTITLARYLE